jgi:hypothetical protein
MFFFCVCCSQGILKKEHALYDDGCFDFLKLHQKKFIFWGFEKFSNWEGFVLLQSNFSNFFTIVNPKNEVGHIWT